MNEGQNTIITPHAQIERKVHIQRSLMDDVATQIPATDTLSGKVTPTPTHLNELVCGSHYSAEYNGFGKEMEVRMAAYDGTMTVDLSASNFQIKSITAYDQLVPLNDTNPSPSILTINALHSKDYYFVIEGANNVEWGTYDIVIECSRYSEDSPTQKTLHPTAIETESPSGIPTESPSIGEVSELEYLIDSVQPSKHRVIWVIVFCLFVTTFFGSVALVCFLKNCVSSPLQMMDQMDVELNRMRPQDGAETHRWMDTQDIAEPAVL